MANPKPKRLDAKDRTPIVLADLEDAFKLLVGPPPASMHMARAAQKGD